MTPSRKEPGTILDKAAKIVDGGRQEEYGKPDRAQGMIAEIWTGLLRDKLKEGEVITPDMVCIMLAGMKLCRLARTPTHRDSQVDVCGYIRLLEIVQETSVESQMTEEVKAKGEDFSDINAILEDLQKPDLNRLFRDNPETPEGKYLVKRRDGTVVEWPHFVLGARDPNSSPALLFYGLLYLVSDDIRQEILEDLYSRLNHWFVHREAKNRDYVLSVKNWAERFEQYRKEHGDGDPLKGRHRKDDPATIEEMRKGYSA